MADIICQEWVKSPIKTAITLTIASGFLLSIIPTANNNNQ